MVGPLDGFGMSAPGVVGKRGAEVSGEENVRPVSVTKPAASTTMLFGTSSPWPPM